MDCHPDTYTAAVFVGRRHMMRVKLAPVRTSALKLARWVEKEFGTEDLFLMEAGANSFEICTRLRELGLRAVVLESNYVGKHAKSYADNDKMAAARIALVYLGGKAPGVWVPDARNPRTSRVTACLPQGS